MTNLPKAWTNKNMDADELNYLTGWMTRYKEIYAKLITNKLSAPAVRLLLKTI
jgi:hypothetical protein